jgi:hypothetical protein
MGEKLKNAGSYAFGLAVILAVLALPFVFIKGAMWASEFILPPLINVGWVVLAITICVLLPLSIFKRLRGFTGSAILITSYIYGLICWFMGFIVTYMLWGLGAIIIGLLFLGGGVVPIGMIASVFKGEWQTLGVLFFLVVLTFGTRFLGIYIAQSAE